MRSAEGNAGERWKTSIGLLYIKRMAMRFPTKTTSSCIWVAIPVEWGHQLRREKSGPGHAKCRSCLPKEQALLTYRDWIGLLAGSDNMLPKRVFSFISAQKNSDISLLKLYTDQIFGGSWKFISNKGPFEFSFISKAAFSSPWTTEVHV